jgi:hypothetical protein
LRGALDVLAQHPEVLPDAPVAERDPEQEVRDMAVPVLVACLQAFREHVPDDPIVSAIHAVVSPEAVTEGEPVRAVDAALVAGQLAAALGPEHVATVSRFDRGTRR